MLAQAARQLERALRLPADANLQRLQPAQHEPGGVGRGDRAGPAAERLDALVLVFRGEHEHSRQRVVVAAEVLRRAVQDDVGAVLERPEEHRGGRGRIHEHGRGMRARGLHVREGQERIGGRLEPDEIDAVRRRAGLVELDEPKRPSARARGTARTSRSSNLRRARWSGPARQQSERRCRRGSRAGGEEQRVPSVQRAQGALRVYARRMVVARVEELARLPVPVRPDGRAVERHQPTLTGSGRRSSSRPRCASEGKSRVHESAMPIVATPPATTDVTVPKSRATTP